MSYPLDGEDGTPILLMDWKDMNWVQRIDFVMISMTLCAPILGVLLGMLATALHHYGFL